MLANLLSNYSKDDIIQLTIEIEMITNSSDFINFPMSDKMITLFDSNIVDSETQKSRINMISDSITNDLIRRIRIGDIK